MILIGGRLYNGLWKWFSAVFIVAVSVAGFFWPIVGLVIPALILVALVTNLYRRRSFCAGVCPNGRSLSASFSRLTRDKPLPVDLRSPMIRRVLCGFMLFCVINLLSRTEGSIDLIGRVFWFIYLVSVGLSSLMAVAFKPRAWCAICPMGTLQDTMSLPR